MIAPVVSGFSQGCFDENGGGGPLHLLVWELRLPEHLQDASDVEGVHRLVECLQEAGSLEPLAERSGV